MTQRYYRETQVAAYNDIVLDLSEKQLEIYNCLKEQTTSMTCRELASILDKEVHQVSPRLSEMMNKSEVFKSEKRKCSVTNKTVSTYTTQKEHEVKQQKYKCKSKDKFIEVSSDRIELNFDKCNIEVYYKDELIANVKKMTDAVDALRNAKLNNKIQL